MGPRGPRCAAAAPRGGKRQPSVRLPPPLRRGPGTPPGRAGAVPQLRCALGRHRGPDRMGRGCAPSPRALAVPPRPASGKGHARAARGPAGRWPALACGTRAAGVAGAPPGARRASGPCRVVGPLRASARPPASPSGGVTAGAAPGRAFGASSGAARAAQICVARPCAAWP